MKNKNYYDLDKLNIKYDYRDEEGWGEVYSFKDHQGVLYEIRVIRDDGIAVKIRYGKMEVIMTGDDLSIRSIIPWNGYDGYILMEFLNDRLEVGRENSICIYDPILKSETI